MELVPACPICASNLQSQELTLRDHHLTKELFSITDCATCGFWFTNPRPDSKEIARFYTSWNYISHSTARSTFVSKIYHFVRRYTLASKYSALRSHVENGSVLDVGCGTGEFLAYLSARGYSVQGVEPVKRAREVAVKTHGIAVLPELAHIHAREQFQIVTLWHVLEHIHDLNDAVSRLSAVLSPGGFLFIAVPVRDSWDAKHYGSCWAALDVPRHLWHFRKQDILSLFSQHGFRTVRTKRMWFDAYYIALLSERYKGTNSLLVWPLALLIGSASNFASLLPGNSTSSLLFIFKKPQTHENAA